MAPLGLVGEWIEDPIEWVGDCQGRWAPLAVKIDPICWVQIFLRLTARVCETKRIRAELVDPSITFWALPLLVPEADTTEDGEPSEEEADDEDDDEDDDDDDDDDCEEVDEDGDVGDDDWGELEDCSRLAWLALEGAATDIEPELGPDPDAPETRASASEATFIGSLSRLVLLWAGTGTKPLILMRTWTSTSSLSLPEQGKVILNTKRAIIINAFYFVVVVGGGEEIRLVALVG